MGSVRLLISTIGYILGGFVFVYASVRRLFRVRGLKCTRSQIYIMPSMHLSYRTSIALYIVGSAIYTASAAMDLTASLGALRRSFAQAEADKLLPPKPTVVRSARCKPELEILVAVLFYQLGAPFPLLVPIQSSFSVQAVCAFWSARSCSGRTRTM